MAAADDCAIGRDDTGLFPGADRRAARSHQIAMPLGLHRALLEHSAGRRSLVTPLSLAAAAAGADGIIVEVHPRPEEALCDAAQQIPTSEFRDFSDEIRALASLMGRTIG